MNNKRGYSLLDLLTTLKKLKNNFPQAEIFMKFTGIYHLLIFNYFTKNNYRCYIINPIYTKNFSKQSIRKIKIDSLRIAQSTQSPMFQLTLFLKIGRASCRERV